MRHVGLGLRIRGEGGSDQTQLGIDVGADLPHLPTTGNQKLTLLFRITEGVTIVSFRIGDVVVGTCSVSVG